MSRKGALWRGELAQRIAECLNGALPGDDLLEWALDHPFFEDREQLSDDEQRIIATGEPIVAKLEQRKFRGRADVWASTTKMPLRDAKGRIIGTFGISRDVTEGHKAFERQIALGAPLTRSNIWPTEVIAKCP